MENVMSRVVIGHLKGAESCVVRTCLNFSAGAVSRRCLAGAWVAAVAVWLTAMPLFAQQDGAKTDRIYDELTSRGVRVEDGVYVRVPRPELSDGLTAEGQKAAIGKILGSDYDYDEFVRKSTVAPVKIRIREVESGAQVPVRGVDVYFVAYGRLDDLESKDIYERLAQRGPSGARSVTIDKAAISERGISLHGTESVKEAYTSVTYPLLDRVEVNVVAHSEWSRTASSLIGAGMVDDRFGSDSEFPNRWRALSPGDEDGHREAKWFPYRGVGYYTKVTALTEPEGALFVESHLVFAEPEGWFDGANLLRSKLPAVIQDATRNFRRELAKP